MFYCICKQKKKKKKIVVEGFFDDGINNKIIDKKFAINNKGKNILDFQKLAQKYDLCNEKKNFIAMNYIIKNTKLIEKNSFSIEKVKNDENSTFKNKFDKIPKSKSFNKIKGIFKLKGILKSVKSYKNITTNKKNVQFGTVKIKKYLNK